jgi:hypothetical protein
LLLTARGTLESLARQGVVLREGVRLRIYDEDVDEHGQQGLLCMSGMVTRDHRRAQWVARLDPSE